MPSRAPTRASAPWAATRGSGGQDPLVELIKKCEGSLGWAPPATEVPPLVDDSKLDFSQCDGDSARMDLVRAEARRRAEANAKHKVYRIEAAKLRRKMATEPSLFTVKNLSLALEYCWRKRISVHSPLGLCAYVREAITFAPEPDKTVDIMHERAKAIEWEQHHDDEYSEVWMGRLTRARGAGLIEVMSRWKHARGQE